MEPGSGTNLMDDGALGSIIDCVEHNSPILGIQLLLGLDILIQLNQLLGDRLAEQVDDSVAVSIRDGVDLGLVVGLIEIGRRDLAVNLGLQNDCVRATPLHIHFCQVFGDARTCGATSFSSKSRR